jgi:SAM-dependent methyltransferase
MINQHLRDIREFEAGEVLPWLPPRGRLLEIGAGAGWQATKFAQTGLTVFAVELADSAYLAHTRFPTIRYDGRALPFADASFDVVYSSNVLEHVPHLEELQLEIVRVLRPSGRIIHVLPTPAWRVATSLAHYLFAAKYLASRLARRNRAIDAPEAAAASATLPGRRSRLRALFPTRHGECGNWITEVYYFSRRRWEGSFRAARLRVEASRAVGLFYTGYDVMSSALSLPARRRLSRVLGSACRLFVLRPESFQP